ncbi:MAG TPA: YHS domain-containing (seleno)protein [Chthoniobacterales bacterium]
MVATFVAVFAAIAASHIVKAEGSQDLKASKTAIGGDHGLLAQAAPAAKKAEVKPKVNVDQNGVILKGYDPVAYIKENRPVKGDPKFSSTYRTATYHFASAANKAAFDKNPANYAPQYGGFCAESLSRGKLRDIDPNVFFVYKGKLYVCSSAKGAKRFYSNPDVNIQKADKNWEFYEPPSNPGFRRYLGS